MPDIQLPPRRFRHPEDAARQIQMSRDRYRECFGRELTGMWPSEGSVSMETLDIMLKQNISWTATDEEIPGTPSYMAPELFNGEKGDAQSDVYAVGVTLYRLFTGHYPYGEVEPFSRPRFHKRTPLEHYRPDLPAWLDGVLTRATVADPAVRAGDAMELALELEHNLAHGPRVIARRQSFYERNPLLFWKIVSLCLLLALLGSIASR